MQKNISYFNKAVIYMVETCDDNTEFKPLQKCWNFSEVRNIWDMVPRSATRKG